MGSKFSLPGAGYGLGQALAQWGAQKSRQDWMEQERRAREQAWQSRFEQQQAAEQARYDQSNPWIEDPFRPMPDGVAGPPEMVRLNTAYKMKALQPEDPGLSMTLPDGFTIPGMSPGEAASMWKFLNPPPDAGTPMVDFTFPEDVPGLGGSTVSIPQSQYGAMTREYYPFPDGGQGSDGYSYTLPDGTEIGGLTGGQRLTQHRFDNPHPSNQNVVWVEGEDGTQFPMTGTAAYRAMNPDNKEYGKLVIEGLKSSASRLIGDDKYEGEYELDDGGNYVRETGGLLGFGKDRDVLTPAQMALEIIGPSLADGTNKVEWKKIKEFASAKRLPLSEMLNLWMASAGELFMEDPKDGHRKIKGDDGGWFDIDE